MADPRRIVVKIGTNTLAAVDGTPDASFLANIASQVAKLRADRAQVLVVSSGAIGAGRSLLGFTSRPQDVRLRQACAAVGQSRLMRRWEEAFAPHAIHVAQLLLTSNDFSHRPAYLSLRNTTEALLERGVVPIINANDVVATDEIDQSFGDNDRLSALVATKVGAGLLVILSDVAGLYTRPPGTLGAELVSVVPEVDEDVLSMAAARPGSNAGRGGMRSKLQAAQLASRGGITVVIAPGREPDVLLRIRAGEAVGTRFLAREPESRKKHWLRIARPAGRIHVDAGAAQALRGGKHLLPAGVKDVEGTFGPRSVVEIVSEKKPFARALSYYSSEDLAALRGLSSAEVRKIRPGASTVNVTRKKNLVLI